MDTYSIIIIAGIIIFSLVLLLVSRQSKKEKEHASRSHIKSGPAHTPNT